MVEVVVPLHRREECRDVATVAAHDAPPPLCRPWCPCITASSHASVSALKKASSTLQCFSGGRSHSSHCDPRWRSSCGGPRLDISFLASVNHATTLDLGAVLEVMVDGSVLPLFHSSPVMHA